ncbi:MAG: class I SAM-dependent methyltransferase [Candidatus Ranarchaeia archaeon]
MPVIQKLVQCLHNKLPRSIHSRIPKRWYKLGDVLIIHLDTTLMEHAMDIAKCFECNVPHVRVVAVRTGPTLTWKRTPSIVRISGHGPNETVHKENYCKFFLDPFKILFSRGNIQERKRMAHIVKPHETVVDMFACVGQFSIPIAVHAYPGRVYAIEKNPLAYEYLVKNIAANDVAEIVTPIFGDSAARTPVRIADRVIMGLIPPDPLPYIGCAIHAIRDRGFIHFHGSYHKRNYKSALISRLSSLPENLKQRIEIREIRVVKKYAPNILHTVADILVNNTSN